MPEPSVLEQNAEPQVPIAISPPFPPVRGLDLDQRISLGCLAGLLICFFAPWIKSDDNVSGVTLYSHEHIGFFLSAIPVLALITLVTYAGERIAQRALGTVTAIAALAGVGYVAAKYAPFSFLVVRWGASFTFIFALVLFAASEKKTIALSVDFAARKLNSRKADVYSHSLTVPSGIHFSTQEFYSALEKAIRAKQWPGVQLFRINYFEAGLFSHGREYLRIIRQRQLFDICAAPFGEDYFFSIREAEIPSVVSARAFIALLLFIAIAVGLTVQVFGLLLGFVVFLFVAIFFVWFLFNILKMGLTQIDSALLRFPVIGPVYEAWFRKETYFQQDSRVVFLHTINELTGRFVEEAVSAKGIKFLDLFEHQPILGELYKRTRTPVKPPARQEA